MKQVKKVREDLKDKLVADVKQKMDSNGNQDQQLIDIKEDAIQQFQQLGFPHAKIEDWKYTSLKNVLKPEYDLATHAGERKISTKEVDEVKLKGFESNVIVLVNGEFDPSLSNIIEDDDAIAIKNLKEAQKSHPEVIKQHLAQYARYSNDGMTALSTASFQDGAFIHVPRNKALKYPVQILYINDVSHNDLFIQPRNLVVLEESAELSLMENYLTIGESHSFMNYVTEAYVGANAGLTHYKLQNDRYNAYQVNTVQVWQEQDSRVTNATITLGNGFTRNNTNVEVGGENCLTNLYGLYMTHDRQFADNHTIVDHKFPNCESNELYKGIMDDESTAVFNGKVFVRPDAQKVNAFQSNRNTLLADKANIFTKPQLEIWADDVQCSHGATSGQLDERELFYMRSRGLSYDKAEALLVYAFAAEVIAYIDIESLRNYINDVIGKRLKINF